jgi:hypothetical protein
MIINHEYVKAKCVFIAKAIIYVHSCFYLSIKKVVRAKKFRFCSEREKCEGRREMAEESLTVKRVLSRRMN